VIDDLVCTVGPDRKVDDVAFLERPLAGGRAKRRTSAEDDEQLLGAVVKVVLAAPRTGIDLVQRRADPLAARKPGGAARLPGLRAPALESVAPAVRRLRRPP